MAKARGKQKILMEMISEIQTLVGAAKVGYMDDRSSLRAEKVLKNLDAAFEKCVEARSLFDPT